MWSFFSRDPTKDFPYDILDKIPGVEDQSIWTLHQGKKKGTGEFVTIFAFDVKGSSETQVQLAKASLKRIKTLRHPNILKFLVEVETDKVIYFATEPVVPLSKYLQDNADRGDQNAFAISWGLHQVVKGLSFLINDCNLVHNNVCMASIFVDAAGEWKLAGLDYMYPAQGSDSYPPVKIHPALEKYDPPEKLDLRKGMRGHKWSSDMWGLGCLIWEVFNGPLPQTSALKSFGKIPKSLVPNYCELVGANPKSRPNPAKFIEECRKPKGFLKNAFVDSMIFMEEIQIKDQAEKSKFFSELTSSLDLFPEAFCRHKILPMLLEAFEFGNAGSTVLAPLFKLGKMLDLEEYQKKIVPCVVKLFSSPDRATRVKLLQQIDSFIEYIQSNVVNDQIFPQVAQGFMDTNPMVRESTIKAMLYMAEKLNYKNLNEELMKQFARLQSRDDQGGIRTNTTICLGKIAGHLSPQIRQKIMISAFLRALKDPFPPARQAGVMAMAATQNYYHLAEIANRLLPSLCPLVMDPEKIVRDQAFKTISAFLAKLEKLSENPELQEEMERDVMMGASGSSSSPASWAGWAVTGMSSLTSKIYKGKVKPQQNPEMSGGVSSSNPPSSVKEQSSTDKKIPTVLQDEKKDKNYVSEDTEEGWDEDNWGNLEESPLSSPIVTSTAEQTGWGDDDDDEDDWGSLENPTPKEKSASSGMRLANKSEPSNFDWGGDLPPDEGEFVSTEDSGLKPASAYNWDQPNENQEDFFSQAMGLPKKKGQLKQSSATKDTRSRQSSKEKSPASFVSSSSSSSQKDQQKSGWEQDTGGWEDDGWGSVGSTSTGTVKSSHKKEENYVSKSDNVSSNTGGSSGWDSGNWEGDGWGTGNSEDVAKKKKEEREQKRLQRQKELQEKREMKKGGALKLGAKKMSTD